MTEIVPIKKFRHAIPDAHRDSLDTRLVWLWNQRFGTIQTIWKDSPDVLDKTACTLILQAIMAKDLNSITLLFQRLEGSAVYDSSIAQSPDSPLRV